MRARVDAATPGPWKVDSYIEEVLDRPDEMRYIVGIEKDVMDWWVKDSNTLSLEDALFIAHARRDMQTLLDEVARLQLELSRSRSDSEYWRQRQSAEALK